jgi:MFS family permease
MSLPRNVRLLGWFNFWLDFRPYAPIAILYFSHVSSSYALGMSIYSTVMLAQSLFEVPAGVFSDRIGRKKTIVIGALASTLSIVFYAIGSVYIVLLIGAIFEGLARAFFSGNNDALLYDTLAENGQQAAFQEYMGKTSSMYQFALAISAFIGSFIAALSFQLVMWVSVIPMFLSFLVSLQFTEPPTKYERASTNIYAHLGTAFRSIMHNPRLRTISAASILSYAIGESSWLFRSAFIATLWPVWALGISQMISNACAALSFYFAGRLIKRFGEFRLLVGGMSISEVVNLLAMLIPTVVSPALMAFSSIFFGVNTVSIGGLLQREFTDEQRATMGSLNSFAGSIAFTIFSFLLGAFADRVGATNALIVAAALMLVPAVLYWRGLRHTTKIEAKVAL